MTEHIACVSCGSPQRSDTLFCSACGETLYLGKEFGTYRVIESIGEGGMGSVYKVIHRTLETHFAAKFLHKRLTKKESLVARFVNEARATSKLRHEHIIFITDFGECSRLGPYIVMENLEGTPLADRLMPGVPFEYERALNIGIQIASAMVYAHRHQIIHRDLKPENIFLVHREGDTTDFVKILDFGIAKILEQSEDEKLTKTGAVIGTPIYMSPEQSLGKEIDVRSDIYALGVILFELFSGEVPFLGDTTFDIISQRLMAPAPPLSTHVKKMKGHPIEQLIELCLKRRPDERIATMQDVKDALVYIREQKEAHTPCVSTHQQHVQVHFSQSPHVTDGYTLDKPVSMPSAQSALIHEAIPKEPTLFTPVDEDEDDTVDISPEQSAKLDLSEAWSPNEESVSPTPLPKHDSEMPPTAIPGELNADTASDRPVPFVHSTQEASSSSDTTIRSGQTGILWKMMGAICVVFVLVVVYMWFFVERRESQGHSKQQVHTELRPTKSKTERRTLGDSATVRASVPTPRRRVLPRKHALPVRRKRTFHRTKRRVFRRIHKRRSIQIRLKRRLPVQAKRIVPPQVRVATRRKPSRWSKNGCWIAQTDRVYKRVQTNLRHVRVHFDARRKPSSTSQHARRTKDKKGWCIPVVGSSVWVLFAAEHIEHADCWFRLSKQSRSTTYVRLKHLDSQGPQKGYCLR